MKVSKHTFNFQQIVITHDGVTTFIPYTKIQGKKEGPTMLVTAGMHGNEINGIAVARGFLDHLETIDLQDLCGTIIVFPILNPSGFAKVERRVAEDNGDLNRSFGYEVPTSFSQAIALELEKIFSTCDFAIDLHDAGGRSTLMPHVRVHKNEEGNITKEMGRIFGTSILIERDGNEHMLAVAMKEKYNMPVITVEIGGAQIVNKEFTAIGVQGLRNMMYSQKMLEGNIIYPQRQYILSERFGIKTNEPAEIYIDKNIGDTVHSGDTMGTIYFPRLQKTQELHAPMCGFVFAKWERNQIPANMVMYGILEADHCHIDRSTLQQFHELPEFSVKQFNFSR